MTEVCLECKEPTSEDIESEVEHEEVPKEDAAVETGRLLIKRHRDRLLAEKRLQELRIGPETMWNEPGEDERTRSDCGMAQNAKLE